MKLLRRVLRRLSWRTLKRSIGARVLAGFGLTAALAVMVAAVSLAYNRDAARDFALVSDRDRLESADLRDLEVSVEQQSGAIQSFLLSGDEQWLVTLSAARRRFEDAQARLDARPAGERGDGAIEEVQRAAAALNQIADDDIVLRRQGSTTAANALWREQGSAAKGQLLDAVERRVQAHNDSIDREIGRSREHLRFAYALSLALVVLAAVLACAIGIAIARGVTGPVRSLVRMAAAVRGGDYAVRAPVHGEDELAALSVTMNLMAESLESSRTQLERALADTERSEERYRLLSLNANDIIFTLDRQGRFTFVNPAVTRMLGYAPAELLQTPANDIFTPATRAMISAREGWVTESPGAFTADLEIVGKDGTVVPLEVNSTVMRVNGAAIGVQGIARDLRERYQMEHELRRLNTRARRRVDQLTTVNEMGRKIAALQPVDTLLPHLVRLLGATFGYQHVRILTVDDDDQLATAAAWQPENSESGAAIAAPSPLVIRALRGDAGFVAGSGRPEDDAETRYTEVAVPVRGASEVLAVLDIRDSAEGGLDEGDIFTLQTLADQIAVAIENARLYEAGQQLAVSEERNRLARELHDSVTQELFSMTMIADAIPKLMERKPEVARERVQRLHELARAALAEMRALLFALRPAALAEEGLTSALGKHMAAIQAREGIAVHLTVEGEGRLPAACEEAFYRITQEALNNVVKHAKAKNVWVNLSIGADETSLSVRDDGVGIRPTDEPRAPTMGLASMRERVEELGGDFQITSATGAGTTVRVTAPIATTRRQSA